MLSKIIKKRYYLIFFIVVVFSVLVPFIASPYFYHYRYAASGDYISPINQRSVFYNNLFVYRPFFGGGTNNSYMISKLFPESLLYLICGFIGLTPSFTTLLYVSLIILASELSMFCFINYILTNKFNFLSDRKYFFSIIAGIIYAFSPQFIASIFPGHFVQLTVYAFFPLLITLFDKNLNRAKFQYRTLVWYFFIFFTCATAFGNVALIYVTVLTFGLYALFSMIVEKLSLVYVIKNLFFLIISIIFSNFFWLFSNSMSFQQLTNLSDKTNADLNSQVYLAVTKVNIPNLFFGKTEWQLYLLNTNYYINKYSLVVYILILFLFAYAILRLYKNRFVNISLLMLISAIFISKGPREPFGQQFMWLYNNLLGFQVFRRPTSKYYGVFLLFYFTLSIIGLSFTSLKLNKRKFFTYIIIPASIITIYIAIIFTKTFKVIPYNIPSYYFEAEKYLLNDNVKNVLVLPGLYGQQPTFDKSVNNLFAIDFLYFIWYFPFDKPADATFSNNYSVNIMNPIIKGLKKNINTCDLMKKAGISHVMVHHDLSPNSVFEDKPEDLTELLDNSQMVENKKTFSGKEGKGFTIYKINSKCFGALIQLTTKNRASTLDFQIINPTKIKISISKLKDFAQLKFLNNYEPTWKLYLEKYNQDFFIKDEPINVNTYPKKNIFIEGNELNYLNKKAMPQAITTKKYAWTNNWSVQPEFIKNNYSNYFYHQNPDGSINLQFVLYFQTQSYLYLGLIIFTVFFVIFTFFLFRILLFPHK